MLILAVDTGGREGSLAVLRDQELLAEIISRPDEPYSSRLFQDLDTLLAQLRSTQPEISLQQFDLFAVAAGPGSFTGLRVGLTAVKAWAEMSGKPVAAVSRLHAVAAQALVSAGQMVASVLDARRGQIFGGLYKSSVGEWGGDGGSVLTLDGEEMVAGADEFLAMVARRANGAVPVFVSPTPEIIRPALEGSHFAAARVEEVSGTLVAVIGRLGHRMALRNDVVDALRLDANYVRRTDAEVKWKDRPLSI